jgi:hypothetical protein
LCPECRKVQSKLKGGSIIIKRIHKTVVTVVVLFSILLIFLNPDRGMFNHAVFEGGSIPITKNQEIMGNIRNINGKDYGNASHPLVKRRNYLLFSIYDVYVSDTKVYPILGFLEIFKLIN